MGSFNIDMNTIMSYAATIFNTLMPIAGIGIGLTLGVGVLAFLQSTIRKAISGMS
jgi:hypothetical protein